MKKRLAMTLVLMMALTMMAGGQAYAAETTAEAAETTAEAVETTAEAAETTAEAAETTAEAVETTAEAVETTAEVAETTAAAAEAAGEEVEGTQEAAAPITGEIEEDGSYVIRIPVEEDDLGWAADEESTDSVVVELESENIEDGNYVVRYKPVADGVGTVTLRHFGRVTCDQMHTFDLKVEDGKVTESVGGSFTASPAEEELDPYILGEWVEPEKQLDLLTITKNEEEGWNMEIVSASGPEQVVVLGTLFYDCELDEFIYPDGEFYQTTISDSEDTDLGEPMITDASGAIRFEADGEDLKLGWYSWLEEQNPEPVLFERVTEE